MKVSFVPPADHSLFEDRGGVADVRGMAVVDDPEKMAVPITQ